MPDCPRCGWAGPLALIYFRLTGTLHKVRPLCLTCRCDARRALHASGATQIETVSK